jgi:hypothetical protein
VSSSLAVVAVVTGYEGVGSVKGLVGRTIPGVG